MCHGVRTLTLINYVHETILRARALMLTAGGLNGTEHAWFCRLGPLFCRHAAFVSSSICVRRSYSSYVNGCVNVYNTIT